MGTKISDGLAKIGNSETGSVFDVIGTTETLVVGIRFWVEQHPKLKHTTVVSFRVRVTAVEGGPQQLNFMAYVSSCFPKVKKWSGQSTKHVSMLGYIGSKFPIWKTAEILDGISTEGLHEKIHEFITFHLEGVSWLLDKEQFKDYMLQQVGTALVAATHTQDEDPKAPAAVLAFDKGGSGGATHPSFQGEDGHPDSEDFGLGAGDSPSSGDDEVTSL